MPEKKFKLQFGVIIPSKKVNRKSEYENILNEFLEKGEATAKIDWTGNKPNASTVAVTLRKIVSEKKLPVKVHGLSGAVYLTSTVVQKKKPI